MTLTRLRGLRHDTVARDAVWAMGLEFVQLAVMLTSFALLGARLGPRFFGSYASMYALIGVLGGFVYSGVVLSLVQHLVREREDLQQTLGSCLGLVLALGSGAAILGTAAGALVVPSVAVSAVACFMLAELVGTAAIQVLASVAYARDGLAISTRYRLMPLLAKFAILLGLFWTGTLTIASLGLAYLVVYPLISFGLAVLIGRRYRVRVRPAVPRLSHARNSLLYSTTLSALTVQNDGDKIVLGAAHVGADAGHYAAAYRLVAFGLVPLRSLLSASHRRFLEHDPAMRGQHIRRALRFSLVGSSYGVVFGLLLFGVAPFITVLLGNQYAASVEMMRLLAPVVAVRAFADFGLNGLLGLGKVVLRTSITLGAATVALTSYVVLVPLLSWRGAVVGTYVSEVVLACAAWTMLVVHQRRHDRSLPPPVASDIHPAGAVTAAP